MRIKTGTHRLRHGNPNRRVSGSLGWRLSLRVSNSSLGLYYKKKLNNSNESLQIWTGFKLRQILRKRTMRLPTWYIQGLRNEQREMFKELEGMNIDVCLVVVIIVNKSEVWNKI